MQDIYIAIASGKEVFPKNRMDEPSMIHFLRDVRSLTAFVFIKDMQACVFKYVGCIKN